MWRVLTVEFGEGAEHDVSFPAGVPEDGGEKAPDRPQLVPQLTGCGLCAQHGVTLSVSAPHSRPRGQQ